MRGADRVYVARTPLVGFESARNAVLKLPLSPRIRSSFESLCDRHVLVVVERESLASDEGRFTSFDFLPVAPTDPETMAKMAFNRPTLGEVRIRSLKGRALSSWSMKGEAPDCIERATVSLSPGSRNVLLLAHYLTPFVVTETGVQQGLRSEHLLVWQQLRGLRHPTGCSPAGGMTNGQWNDERTICNTTLFSFSPN